MAGELGDIQRLAPNRITEAVSKREGRSGKRGQFQSLLKREEEEEHPPPRPADSTPTPDAEESPRPDTPLPGNLGKVIDFEA
jgi:hypothetical protein